MPRNKEAPEGHKKTVDTFAVMLTDDDVELKRWLKAEVANGILEGRYEDGMTMSRLVLHMLRTQRQAMQAMRAPTAVAKKKK